jgi:hypothetical protein
MTEKSFVSLASFFGVEFDGVGSTLFTTHLCHDATNRECQRLSTRKEYGNIRCND